MNIDIYRSLIDFDEAKRKIEFEAIVAEPETQGESHEFVQGCRSYPGALSFCGGRYRRE